MAEGRTLRVGHSPDADDAFMFFGIVVGAVSLDGWRIEHVLADIETLNDRAFRGELEVTAISAAVYPWVASRYRLLRVGASVGRRYGPKVLTRESIPPDDLRGRRIAVPGRHTTAFLLLRLYLPDFEPVIMTFDRILSAVARGEVDAGLVIHEGQLTYPALGLCEVVDLGHWWADTTGLPIPLGVNVVRRDLGEAMAESVACLLRHSILYAMLNMKAALEYARVFGRGIDTETCRTFVQMYVNDDTLCLKSDGEQALQVLY
ncbi:MAG: ABC transporter substrate-binding protein, partial [Acidobacteria bacterium]|nr:ABC transporter substrate-binding protein [Acidobacteriota bacterium]MDW7983840.1 MqnA/MqnD/SBP family protein [Acidobacteriota bacterium]